MPKTGKTKSSVPGTDLILDMYSSSIDTHQALDDEQDDRVVVDATVIDAIKRALQKARGQGTFEILTKRKLRDQFFKVATRARIQEFTEAREDSRYLTVVIMVSWPDNDAAMTKITVEFGRDRNKGNEWFRLQGNPTSTMTGQNTWPMQREVGSEDRQKRMMFAWPYWTLLTVCKAADSKFNAPASLVKRILRGETTLQNLQIAIYLKLKANDKSTFCALVGAGFRTPRVRARSDGKLEAFDIGARLGIKAEAYTSAETDDGVAPWASLMLRKFSGNNQIATLTFYDKAAEQKLTPAQAKVDGLADLIRADITLAKRGMNDVFSAAKKLAAKHHRDLELTTNANGQVVTSVANVVKAIDVLDKHYSVKIGRRTSKEFRAWLLVEIVHKRFYLRELLSYTPKRWEEVEAWMTKWSAKNVRYAGAFDAWRKVSTSNTTLYDCFTSSGLSNDTAAARIKELNKIGFSGDIPPIYWTNRRTMARSWGSTDEEETLFWKLDDAGESTSELEKQWKDRVEAGKRIARRVINRVHVVAPVRNVSLAGNIEPVPKVETKPKPKGPKR